MVNPNADPKPMSSLAALVSVAFVFVAVACTRPGATPARHVQMFVGIAGVACLPGSAARACPKRSRDNECGGRLSGRRTPWSTDV